MFSVVTVDLPPIPNALSPERYERLKGDIFALMLTQRMRVFDAEGAGQPSGPWKPLAQSTNKARLRKVSPARRGGVNAVKILQDKGILRQAFTHDGAAGMGKYLEGDEVRLENNVEYARIHNEGGRINVPKREREITISSSGRFGKAANAKSKKTGEIKPGWSSRRVTIPAHTITIPARPFNEFSEDDRKEIAQHTREFLSGGE